MAKESFNDVLTQAVADITAHGYDSAERVAYWTRRLRDAATDTLPDASQLAVTLREALAANYRKLVDGQQVLKLHPGISRFTLEKVRPQLRAELDRRIMASAGLIKLNREAAVEKTLQRFAGWSTSIPAGGSRVVDRIEVKEDIRKSLVSEKYAERRVLIDQGHKLTSAINDILAKDGGAIAVIWHSHWRQAGYNYRHDHKERDGLIYAIRGNWAFDKGLAKVGPDGYLDQITQPAEEPFCRCFGQYVYSISALPSDMLTKKGADELARVRAAIAA